MQKEQTHKALDVIRWVGFLPVACVAAWLAWIVMNILGRFSFGWVGITADDFRWKLYIMTAGHAVMGVAFVYVGAIIAPAHRVIVVFILGGIGIVISGFLLFPAVMVKDWWAVLGSIFVAIGAGVVVWTVYTGETDFE